MKIIGIFLLLGFVGFCVCQGASSDAIGTLPLIYSVLVGPKNGSAAYQADFVSLNPNCNGSDTCFGQNAESLQVATIVSAIVEKPFAFYVNAAALDRDAQMYYFTIAQDTDPDSQFFYAVNLTTKSVKVLKYSTSDGQNDVKSSFSWLGILETSRGGNGVLYGLGRGPGEFNGCSPTNLYSIDITSSFKTGTLVTALEFPAAHLSYGSSLEEEEEEVIGTVCSSITGSSTPQMNVFSYYFGGFNCATSFFRANAVGKTSYSASLWLTENSTACAEHYLFLDPVAMAWNPKNNTVVAFNFLGPNIVSLYPSSPTVMDYSIIAPVDWARSDLMYDGDMDIYETASVVASLFIGDNVEGATYRLQISSFATNSVARTFYAPSIPDVGFQGLRFS